MRIISQDRTIDVNYDRCTIRHWTGAVFSSYGGREEKGTHKIVALTDDAEYYLATYLTKERALEVMVEIASSWMNSKSNSVFVMHDD